MSELELELRELRIEWPETPDIASAVEARLAAPPARRRWRLDRPGWQLAVAATALIIAVVMVIPPARAAVLDLLGFGSVRITREEPSNFGRELALGDPVTLEQARDAFPVLLPEELGEPAGVYLYEHAQMGPRVDLVYRTDSGRLLVTEFHAVATPLIEKTLGTGAKLERLRVDGDQAFFISGAPHGFAYLNPETGDANFEEQRLAGNTLLVERADGVLVRMEADFTRDEALALAESLR